MHIPDMDKPTSSHYCGVVEKVGKGGRRIRGDHMDRMSIGLFLSILLMILIPLTIQEFYFHIGMPEYIVYMLTVSNFGISFLVWYVLTVHQYYGNEEERRD